MGPSGHRGPGPHLLHHRTCPGRGPGRRSARRGTAGWAWSAVLRDIDPLQLAAGQPVGARVRVLGEASSPMTSSTRCSARPRRLSAGKRSSAEYCRARRAVSWVCSTLSCGTRPIAVAEFGVVPVQIAVVVQHGACVRGAHPGQRAEQGRLARTARPMTPSRQRSGIGKLTWLSKGSSRRRPLLPGLPRKR